MMGFRGVYCQNLKQKDDARTARRVLYNKRQSELINELVDPICIISNANEILSKRLNQFVDDETRSYFDMITRSITKIKTLVEELRDESKPVE